MRRNYPMRFFWGIVMVVLSLTTLPGSPDAWTAGVDLFFGAIGALLVWSGWRISTQRLAAQRTASAPQPPLVEPASPERIPPRSDG